MYQGAPQDPAWFHKDWQMDSMELDILSVVILANH